MAHVSLVLAILLLRPSECWDYKHILSCLVQLWKLSLDVLGAFKVQPSHLTNEKNRLNLGCDLLRDVFVLLSLKISLKNRFILFLSYVYVCCV